MRPTPSVVHVAGGADARIVFADGDCATVLASYPEHHGLILHSLSAAVLFSCTSCRRSCEATVIATRGTDLVCPACYGRLGSDEAGAEPDLLPTADGIPVQRLTRNE
jgi:hypothetical protein